MTFMTAPPVGVWLGRAPTVEERVAFAKGRHGHRSHHPPEDLGWWACVYDDGEVAPCLFRGDGALNHTLDAAPARDEAHARALCEKRQRQRAIPSPDGLAALAAREAGARPTKAPEVDPRIGRWWGVCGRVLLMVGSDKDGCPICMDADGNAAAYMDEPYDEEDPPSPIPEPCRPVWEAFEALRRERSRTAAVTPEPPPGPAEGDVWAEIIAGLDESDPLGDARETLYTAAAVRRLWGQLELKANPTTTNP